MDRWKSRDGKTQGREENRREEKGKDQRNESQKKEDTGARKGKTAAKHIETLFVFPLVCGSGGSKSRLAKAAGAARSEMNN